MEIFAKHGVSHITLFHSLILTLDLFLKKADKFIASRTTADGYRIDFNHDQRRSYLYRYMDQCPTNSTFTNRYHRMDRIDIEMDVLNRKQTSDWKHIEQIVRMSGCYLGIAWLHCQPDLITWVKMLY